MSTRSGKDTFISDQHELARWRTDQRNERDAERASNPLADLLVFLADGFQTGTLQARALAFLWVLRPDLVAAEGGAQNVDAVSAKAGLSRQQLTTAVRHLRTTAPELDQVMRNVQTSRARFLALAEIKARRRKLDQQDRETMAEARRALAHERVRAGRKHAREWARENYPRLREDILTEAERRRLKVARQVLALADPLLKAAAADMRAFDRSMGLKA